MTDQHPPMLVVLNTSSGVPIYRQIVDQVKQQTASGRLVTGRRLDSVRLLARRLRINPMTVAKAYAILAAQRVVRARPGAGYFVVDPPRELTAAARRERLAQLLAQVAAESYQLGLPQREAIELLADRLASTSGPPAARESADRPPEQAVVPQAARPAAPAPIPPTPPESTAAEAPEDIALL